MLSYLHYFKIRVEVEDESRFIELCKKYDISISERIQCVINYAIVENYIEFRCFAGQHSYILFTDKLKELVDITATIIHE